MPSKGRNNKNFEKFEVKSAPKVNNPGSTISTITLTPQLEQQFETELCWCIQNLQNALKSGKLNNKQVQDHTKALNTLMNNSTSMIRKRQVMRLSFGDYRAKMAAEEKKFSRKAVNIKLKPGVPSKKSVFVKKSAFTSSLGNKFQFNFQHSSDDELIDNLQDVKIEPEENTSHNDFAFVPSDNSFRFSFDVAEKS